MVAQQLVVLGGSSGGLEAMLAILAGLTPEYDIPTILVLHQRANRRSGVPDMLARYTHLRVVEPDDKQKIEYGYLYVAPPNYHLLVEKEKCLSLSSDPPVHFCRPAIDVTLETAALAFGADLVACILSGANKDGADGAVQVKHRGGQVYIQHANLAEMAVMPLATGAAITVDGALAPDAMAAMLNRLARCRSMQ